MSSMAIETTLASDVRGVVIRPLLVAALATLWRNSGFFMRLVASLAIGRGVLHDGPLGALHTAMTIETRRCRRRREGVADEAVGLGRAASMRMSKLLLVAFATNFGTRARECCPIDVMAFPTCNRSFTDVSFVSGTGPKLCP
jgi:hypothetical protein